MIDFTDNHRKVLIYETSQIFVSTNVYFNILTQNFALLMLIEPVINLSLIMKLSNDFNSFLVNYLFVMSF